MDFSKKTVLVLDDEPEVLEIIQMMVEDLGVKVIATQDGHSALKTLEQEHIDCVVSDIRMPEMDGIKFASMLRETGNMLPIIFMTGFAETKIVNQCWKLGAFDFLDKPVEMEELHNTIKKALIFGDSFLPKSDKKVSYSFDITDTTLKSFESACSDKNCNPEAVLNSLIIKYISNR